ncbi:hypothetical protein BLNAU_2039 [Blattamonas nauphoetae]|nr:hypothetical protein BLNAU_3205 [Blattamonas nauphoetae]KAK2963016.1 hypothetical protein BLNAU_2039 [Blattamonas nauphoetae]
MATRDYCRSHIADAATNPVIPMKCCRCARTDAPGALDIPHLSSRPSALQQKMYAVEEHSQASTEHGDDKQVVAQH